MKLLTTSFLTCAVKSCRTSASTTSTLHFKDCTLSQSPSEPNVAFLSSVLKRVDWPIVRRSATELGFPNVMEENPADVLERGEEVSEETWRDVHRLLVEIEVDEGKLVCETCGHEYAISQGICNFLLPGHLV